MEHLQIEDAPTDEVDPQHGDTRGIVHIEHALQIWSAGGAVLYYV
jgi:hypothetical protein